MTLSDLEIAQTATLRPIADVADDLGICADQLEFYGKYKAKLPLDLLDHLPERPRGKYILVTAITPTPLGEGKSTTAVGLGQALARLGQKALVTLRQPSIGPVFGIKGGAAGGGRAQVVPMEDLNLHLTGDFHAVTQAHNLCAAFIDNHLYHGNKLGIDPSEITWRRVLDVNDRALRDIVTGLGTGNGVVRQTGFDITAASEVMAILALATDLQDLRKRLGRIIVAETYDKQPVTAEDIGVAGAMAVVLKDAIKPTLMQTLEGSPVLIHTGPFGNIAHGNSSVIADRLALGLADVVVTEAGFGSDLGAEKFFNIKCRVSDLAPDAAVVVATVRALKAHSDKFKIIPGRPLDPLLLTEDLDALRSGLPNLAKHIDNVRIHGVPVVVAINAFPTDTPAELEAVRQAALAAGADDAVISTVWADGGAGGEALGQAVLAAAERGSNFRYLYDVNDPITTKIERIATTMYGAGAVHYEPLARRKIAQFENLGYGNLPICMV
jgi:formate--tetrahydrofolate ligase